MSNAIEQDLNIFLVRDAVKRRMGDPAGGGGFVFAAVHGVQAYKRRECIMAPLATAAENGRYA